MKKKDVYKGIGIMSGTSLDGLDIAYTEFHKKDGQWKYKTTAVSSIEYTSELKTKFKKALKMTAAEIAAFDIAFGLWVGERTSEFIKKNKLKPDFIASHGHTIFHQPENNFTLQIGDGSAIYAKTGIPVIFNFRKLDIALGGQGAPLVPVGDSLLYGEYDFCLNLGGIANITRNVPGEVRAYDVCPANMVLNYLAKRQNAEYDDKGEMAASGELIEPLLQELDSLNYYDKSGPKSLGYEHVSETVFPFLSKEYVVEDLLHTYCHHIAKMIASQILKFNGNEKERMLVTGGGAHNKYLIKLLKEYCKPVKIEVPDKQTVDFKEAIVFSFLGLLRMLGENNVWSKVTGASRDSCSGTIVGGFQEKS